MEYGILGQIASDCPEADRPVLASIGDAADELERISGYLASFIARCRGGVDGDSAKGGPTPVPSGHFGQLDRLHNNLVRVDQLARELQTIG